MTDLNVVLDEAVSDKSLPFVVAMVANRDGVMFSGAAGFAAKGRLADETTMFRAFSMTKGIGSLAAMILIDRGQLSMDTPVGDILPEWDELPVLTGFDGETPLLRAQKSRATVRHLATHTSGMEYDLFNADIAKYTKVTRHPSVTTGLKKAMMLPLTSDPGTRWGYGPSTDWLGQIVEAVDGRRIDAFCADEIFGPLGMDDATFEIDGRADRLADLSLRAKDGAFEPLDVQVKPNPEVYGMGHALFLSAPDYLKFLRMVLNKGQLDGKRVLSESALDQMLVDQMQGLVFTKMKSAVSRTANVNFFPGTKVTHSFAFMRNEEDIPGKRSAGSQGWAGLANTHYWVDPARDVAAVIMTQLLPFVEAPMLKTYDAFERTVYAEM
ncbi:MAG: beta-lactamase family protein [Rhodobacteraceae bacterium]|nr:beta-lactamase family protein [Paracoccaceae bacterium]